MELKFIFNKTLLYLIKMKINGKRLFVAAQGGWMCLCLRKYICFFEGYGIIITQAHKMLTDCFVINFNTPKIEQL